MSDFKIGQKVWWYDYAWEEVRSGKIINKSDMYFNIRIKDIIELIKYKALFATEKEALEWHNKYLRLQIDNLQHQIDKNSKKLYRLKQ